MAPPAQLPRQPLKLPAVTGPGASWSGRASGRTWCRPRGRCRRVSKPRRSCSATERALDASMQAIITWAPDSAAPVDEGLEQLARRGRVPGGPSRHVHRVLDGVPVAVLGPPRRPVREADHLRRRPRRRTPSGARGSPRARPARRLVTAAASSTWPSSARSRRCVSRGSPPRRPASASLILYSGVMSTIVDSMAAFGERLRAERRARGWPIDRLAAASGVSRAMISKIERGESSPTAVVLGKLSAALELSIAELLARRRDPARPGRQQRGPAAGRRGDSASGGGLVRRAADAPRVARPGHRLPAPAGVDAAVPRRGHRGRRCRRARASRTRRGRTRSSRSSSGCCPGS